MNARRFLSLDLNYGRRVDSEMYEYLMDNGMTREEYHFFLTHHLRQHCIMGNDYYITNEHRVAARRADLGGGRNLRILRRSPGNITTATVFRSCIPRPTWRRGQTVMKRPTGCGRNGPTSCASATAASRSSGFTWYSLTDQVDWDTALREENGRVNPLGLYDLDRKIRPVGKAYQQLIQRWRQVLPTQSVCLTLPVIRPSQFDRRMPCPSRKRLGTCAAAPRIADDDAIMQDSARPRRLATGRFTAIPFLLLGCIPLCIWQSSSARPF